LIALKAIVVEILVENTVALWLIIVVVVMIDITINGTNACPVHMVIPRIQKSRIWTRPTPADVLVEPRGNVVARRKDIVGSCVPRGVAQNYRFKISKTTVKFCLAVLKATKWHCNRA
jgi:hypothetical protein